MEKFFENSLPTILTMIAGLLIIILIGSCATKRDINTWNNGIHKDCGGHWQYEQAVGHLYSTNYIYVCDKCNVRETFLEMR